MEPGIPDPDSRATRLGMYNVDPAVRFWATPPVHGILRPTVVHPGRFTFKLPDNVSFAEAAMVEPLAVGVHGATKARGQARRRRPSSSAPARSASSPPSPLLAAGCARVFVTDVDEAKLDLAATPRRRSRRVNVRTREPRQTVVDATPTAGAPTSSSNAPATPAARPASSSRSAPAAASSIIGGQSEPIAYDVGAAMVARGPRRARLPLRPRLPALHRHARPRAPST